MLVASVGIVWGYAGPVYNGDTGAPDFSGKSIKELKIDIDKYNRAYDRLREIEEVKSGLQTRYNSISEKDREKLGKALPKEVDVIRLVVDMTNRASVYGMALKNIEIGKNSGSVPNYTRPGETPLPGNSSSKYPYVDLAFDVTGSYANIVSLVGDLEKSLKAIDLSSVSINLPTLSNNTSNTKTVAPTSNNIYTAKIVLKSYYLPSLQNQTK